MRKEEGIVIIDDNTIYEIDTKCMECKKSREKSFTDYHFTDETKEKKDRKNSEMW